MSDLAATNCGGCNTEPSLMVHVDHPYPVILWWMVEQPVAADAAAAMLRCVGMAVAAMP